MKLHDLRPAAGANRRRRRVARGNSGRGGTYAGRGRKGQGARSGEGRRPYFEGGQLPFVRRLPFRRGFKRLFKVVYSPVNLDDLDARFSSGADVTVEALVEAGLLRSVDEPYKVLAQGEVKKKLTIHAPRFSKAAREAIEKAGGACVYVPDGYRRLGLSRPHPRH